MSSFDGMNTADSGIDLWRVQLGTGEIRAMSLDALDEAFQAGTIDVGTPVLAPGATSWAKLADAAGLDSPSPEPEANVPSVAPIAVSLDSRTGPSTRYIPADGPSLPDLDLDTLEPDAFKPKKGRVFAVIGVAVMLVGGLGFAATRVGNITGSATNSLGAPVKAAAATPPPEAVDLASATPGKTLTEEQKQKLMEADKAREAAAALKRKDRPSGPPARAPREKSATPFVNGGNKYDPLNGAL
jgi:hypothetical protein